MKKLTEEWSKAAEDDLRVIERIGWDERLTHMVAFHIIGMVFLPSLSDRYPPNTPPIAPAASISGTHSTSGNRSTGSRIS
jgi:hypothetical protein